MTSPIEHQHAIGRTSGDLRPVRRRRLRLLLPVFGFALVVAGCSSGPGSQEELEQILVDGGTLSESESACIAEAVFDEYEEDNDALSVISSAPSFEFLASEEGVPGFAEFFDGTVQQCSAIGPTSG